MRIVPASSSRCMGGRKYRVRPTVDFSEIKKMKANGRYAIGVPKSKISVPFSKA